MPSNWRVLIIEDDKNICSQVEADATLGRLLPDVGKMQTEVCQTFDSALPLLDSTRFDFLILDLGKDQDAVFSEDASGGLTIFEEIKKRRFVPVVFYTALAHHVRDLETAFVRVVEKTEGLPGLRREIKRVFETGLPNLLQHIEEEQRKYMWDFVENSWHDAKSCYEKADLTYLLARRLAHSLRECSVRRFLKAQGVPTPGPEEVKKIHPVEMYIKPVIDSYVMTGDILKGTVNGDDAHWVVLTPSCDFEQQKVEQVLLAKCFLLEKESEYTKYCAYLKNGKKVSKTAENELSRLLSDNRKTQPERFKFLPGTFFLPNLVVDFQFLVQVPLAAAEKMSREATLDSPYVEALLARFSRYYGRLGVPNLDIEIVMGRLSSGGDIPQGR